MSNIKEKAVLLSDIEFLEMHSSDWKRIEEASFDVDLIQTLNEYQRTVLDWMKNEMLDTSDFYNTLYCSRKLYIVGEPHRKENIAFMKLSDKELAQVIQAFSKWAIEQEEA